MISGFRSEFRQLSNDYDLVAKAIAFLDENTAQQPELPDIARAVGVSEFHFQRVFTRWAGISPKRFLQFLTRERARELLERSENLLDTTFQLGLSSPGRLHDVFVTTEAVTPGEYKSRGAGVTIRYGVFPTPFGDCLLGVTERGICHLGFVQGSEGDALDEMATYWQQAKIVEDHGATAPLVEAVFRLGQSPTTPIHVLLRGTNFQIKVWEALLRIPVAHVSTYADIAGSIGQPRAVRAVGGAVARNPIPVLIPCHRVIRKLGEFGNYRYGATRKRALIAWEFARTDQLVETAKVRS
jgi:AraC family transcriptional regulator, regulatory protein of adaptative response / methylated-DNA-[protein]-cysteine methyltransferase